MSGATPPEFSLRSSVSGDLATLVVEGEVDVLTSVRLGRELERLLAAGAAVTRVDLHGVTFMDTSGVAILLKARRRATETGGRLVVESASPFIERLFQITGLSQYLMDPAR